MSVALVVLAMAQLPSRLTFTKDIAPIVWSRCATCHRPGEIGPFDQFEDDRQLRPAEWAMLRDWLAAGAPEGDPRDLPPLPTVITGSTGWKLGPPDLVVTMPQPYAVPAGGGDTFRTFVLPIPIDRPRYVRAMEFRPD